MNMRQIRTGQIAIIIAVFCLSLSAQANLMELSATNNTSVEPGRFSGFSLVFNDTGDGLFDYTELVTFSGIDDLLGISGVWDVLKGAPEIAGISVKSGLGASQAGNYWMVANTFESMDGSWIPERWNYTVSNVPEPASIAMILFGFFGLALMRRKASR